MSSAKATQHDGFLIGNPSRFEAVMLAPTGKPKVTGNVGGMGSRWQHRTYADAPMRGAIPSGCTATPVPFIPWNAEGLSPGTTYLMPNHAGTGLCLHEYMGRSHGMSTDELRTLLETCITDWKLSRMPREPRRGLSRLHDWIDVQEIRLRHGRAVDVAVLERVKRAVSLMEQHQRREPEAPWVTETRTWTHRTKQGRQCKARRCALIDEAGITADNLLQVSA